MLLSPALQFDFICSKTNNMSVIMAHLLQCINCVEIPKIWVILSHDSPCIKSYKELRDGERPIKIARTEVGKCHNSDSGNNTCAYANETDGSGNYMNCLFSFPECYEIYNMSPPTTSGAGPGITSDFEADGTTTLIDTGSSVDQVMQAETAAILIWGKYTELLSSTV